MSVYRIYKEGCDECYIGSTINIKRRILNHKTRCNNVKDPKTNIKVYQFIRENGGWDEWKHEILIHTDIVDNPDQLSKIEQDMIDKFKPSLNGRDASKSVEKRKLQFRQYSQRNKEKIREYRLEKIECELCGCLTCRASLRRHQQSMRCKNSNNKN